MSIRNASWDDVARFVEAAVNRAVSRMNTPRESYKIPFLTVEDANAVPRALGVERMIFDEGAVTVPAPGTVRIAGGGGGGGGHGYTWFVYSWDLSGGAGFFLNLTLPVLSTETLSKLKWRHGAGTTTIDVYLNGSPALTQVCAGDSAATIALAVSENDTLAIWIDATDAGGNLTLTIAS